MKNYCVLLIKLTALKIICKGTGMLKLNAQLLTILVTKNIDTKIK